MADEADALFAGLKAGRRRALARAITFAESTRDDHRLVADELLRRAEGESASSIRIGVTGPPGVGKSSLLDVLGDRLVLAGRRPAVLAIDPSSERSGGSILGDGARMDRLSRRPQAFVRASATRGHLGGTREGTHEAIVLCEAAGYDVVLVETVGVGQSETEVRNLVDCVVLLLQPGAGDELQGIKRGVLECADLIFVGQADGERLALAETTRDLFARAMRIAYGHDAPQVGLSSSRLDERVAGVWEAIDGYVQAARTSGRFEARRRRQRGAWFRARLDDELRARIARAPGVAEEWSRAERAAEAGTSSVAEAVNRALRAAGLSTERK